MNISEIKRTIGNFRRFTNMQFPLDADGLADSQTNDALLSVLGNIGGDKYILSGLTAGTGNAGYVFLATADFPSGELLYVEPAAMTSSHLCLRIEPVNISASGYQYDRAYTRRTLYHGVQSAGVESFLKSDFRQLETNASLKARVDTLTESVRNFSPEAVGSIKMWASNTFPANWLVCAGQALSTTDYAALFAILDYQYGGSGSSFNLPDLRGRSAFGFDETSGDFNPLGKSGGAKTHTLSVDEMPAHKHGLDDGDNAPWRSWRIFSSTGDGGNRRAMEMPMQFRETNATGGGLPHNNMPPYITLNFIIRAK